MNKTNDNHRIVSMKRNNPVHEGTKNHGKKNVVREMNICFNNNKDRFLDLFLVQQKWSKKDESTNRKDVEQRIPREKEKSMIKNQHMTINNNTCANHNWKDIFGIVGNSADMSKLKLSKDRRRRRQAHTKSREKLKEIASKYTNIKEYRKYIINTENTAKYHRQSDEQTKNENNVNKEELEDSEFNENLEDIEPFSVHNEEKEPYSVNV
eukprot:TRINITY_DN13420_c0_g1_i1.p1 TRINITY_DN13420_c0_g1~~TRINITY_DN13420_c0_g1_i1.p1  ORF type:complete len:209 (-),score=46.95 TRINITY_DN13420_c0_g1_i1:48-674(-)